MKSTTELLNRYTSLFEIGNLITNCTKPPMLDYKDFINWTFFLNTLFDDDVVIYIGYSDIYLYKVYTAINIII